MSTILGNRIRTLRSQARLNQIELSKKLNISNTTLSQYESGTRIPSDDIKIKIADLFNVSVDYLLGTSDVPSPTKKSTPDSEELEILKRKFVEHGIIKEGEDLTSEQLDDYLKKLSTIISAFKD